MIRHSRDFIVVGSKNRYRAKSVSRQGAAFKVESLLTAPKNASGSRKQKFRAKQHDLVTSKITGILEIKKKVMESSNEFKISS